MTPAERFDDLEKRTDFLEMIGNGVPYLHAALAVGWTPATLKRIMQDGEFRDLCNEAEALMVGTVERVVYDQAKLARPWAVHLFLYNRAPERWRPPTSRVEIKQEHSVSGATISAITRATRELVESLSIAELQALPPMIEGESWEDGNGD